MPWTGRSLKRSFAALLAVWLWIGVFVGAARAGDTLTWSAPAGCPPAAEVERALERVLQGTSERARAEIGMRAEARVSGDDDDDDYRVALTMQTRDGVSERQLRADQCRALADAVVLVIAMAVDPSAALPSSGLDQGGDEAGGDAPEVPEPARAPSPARAEPSEPAARAPSPRVDAGRSTSRVSEDARGEPAEPPTRAWGQLAPAMNMMVGTGGLPGVGVGVALGLDYLGRRWRLGARGVYWLQRRRALDELGLDGASMGLALGAARLRGCGVLGSARLEVPLCAGLELGGMRGAGGGLPVNEVFTGLWTAIVASPGLRVRLTPALGLALQTELGLALTRPAFTVAPRGRVYRAPRTSLALALGIELRFGPGR